MSYQVLARKWRPQDFAAVVGQAPIVTALRNALADGRIAQAYLFSGIRGVGKTSVARILAKALNCERGPAADPCNECTVCREITRGDDLDVLEFDAATYSKVDQVRELTESLPYSPARDRYKVIILDEIHRLSRQAFDALLKIVEEPPPHLIFIFATTEAEAVPVTVLSRCQEFRFRRVPLEELIRHLEMLAREEEIEVGPAALRLVARAGDGSVRDAVALLDQLATFGSGTIADEDAARLLGGMGNEMLLGLLDAVLGGDSGAVSRAVGKVDESGWDPRHVYGEFLGFCRTALHLALDGDPQRADMPLEEARALAERARDAGHENLLRLLHLLLESEATVRRSESGSLAVEVAWLRGAELPKLVAIEDLLAGREPAGGKGRPAAGSRKRAPEVPGTTKRRRAERSAAAASSRSTGRGAAVASELASPPAAEPERAAGPSTGSARLAAVAAELARPAAAPPAERSEAPVEAAPPDAAAERGDPGQPATAAAAAAPPPEPAPEPAAAASAGAEPTGSSDEPDPVPLDGEPSPEAFLELISRRKQSLAAHLSHVQRFEVVDGTLTIFVAPGDDYLDGTLHRDSNAALIEKAIGKVWGPGVRWRVRPGAESAPAAAAAAAETKNETAVDSVLEDPRVQTVLDIFGGSVESVDEQGTD